MKFDVESFCQHPHNRAYTYFGAHLCDEGVTFRVYAPNAARVSVAGSFNGWNYYEKWMNRISDSGIYELFIPQLREWDMYKFGVFKEDGSYVEKADPYSFYNELSPGFASKVVDIYRYQFNDQHWMQHRDLNFNRPMNIYEVHLGSWIHEENMTYESLAYKLVEYLEFMNYTHVELMPVTEHPFLGSWGYQVTGFFAVTSRYGSLDQFKKFVDVMHQHGYGVILDVVPVHFVKDTHGLCCFDGTDQYEMHEESEWGTHYFDYSKVENQTFFISSVSYWIEMCHIDGLRMDAISNLIYYQGNRDRGENGPGIHFLKTMNHILKKEYPTVMLIAEDSSDYGNVTKSETDGGLGFHYKWDLGWMNDTLEYYVLDPIYKKDNHKLINYSMYYFYSERFLMPLSHDEVVHGKKTIVDKMWGDYDQKFALAKNLYLYMMTHPGKKLNFMGNEMGHFREWDEEKPLDWFLLDYPRHLSFRRYIQDLNHIYSHYDALWENDYGFNGFKWIEVDNHDQSIYSYYRVGSKSTVIVVLNMTPVSYERYDVGVPESGTYIELINSERDIYEGCNMTNYVALDSSDDPLHQQPHRIQTRLAPFAAVMFIKDTYK